jgi:hypothetical protein
MIMIEENLFYIYLGIVALGLGILVLYVYFPIMTFFHELGHYIYLRFVFKETDTGIVFGNVHGSEKWSKTIFGIKFHSFTNVNEKKSKGSRGFVYPWNNIYKANKSQKIFFASGGYLFSWLISIISILIMYINNNLFIDIILFPFSVLGIFDPLIVFFRVFKDTREKITSIDTLRLVKVEEGIHDGRLILDESKITFSIMLTLFLLYLIFYFVLLWNSF